MRWALLACVSACSFKAPPRDPVTPDGLPPAFGLTLLDAPSEVKQGEMSAIRVGVDRRGALGAGSLALLSAPQGITATAIIADGANEALLPVLVGYSAAPGSITLDIVGEVADKSAHLPVTFTVLAASRVTGLVYAHPDSTYPSGFPIAANTPILTGGGPPYHFTSDPLPNGLHLDPTSGEISGTPSQVTSGTYAVRVVDQIDGSADASVHINVIAGCDGSCAMAPVGWSGPGAFATGGTCDDAVYDQVISAGYAHFSAAPYTCNCSCAIQPSNTLHAHFGPTCPTAGAAWGYPYGCYSVPNGLPAAFVGSAPTGVCVTTANYSTTYSASDLGYVCEKYAPPAATGACPNAAAACWDRAHNGLCVWRHEDVPCPDEYPRRTLLFQSAAPSNPCPTCGGCASHTPPTSVVYKAYTSANCDGLGGAKTLVMDNVTCNDLTGYRGSAGYEITGGSCVPPAAPGVTGIYERTYDITVCCQ